MGCSKYAISHLLLVIHCVGIVQKVFLNIQILVLWHACVKLVLVGCFFRIYPRLDLVPCDSGLQCNDATTKPLEAKLGGGVAELTFSLG